MAADKMPITPDVVTWARERLGYSLEELAQKRPEFKKIAEWESGDSRPTYRQLESLAKVLTVPVAIFFFPAPPDLPRIEETFRTLSAEQFAEIPPRIRVLLHKARAFQIGLGELNDGRNPAHQIVTRDLSLSINDPVSFIVRQVREFLGVSLADQFKWPDAGSALKAWRTTFYNVGVTVFKDAFRERGYSGFSLYDKEFPIIYVNNSNTKARQIFTLFHELAHLLLHMSGIDRDTAFRQPFPADKRRIEKTCDSLASAILVPEEALNAEILACAADRSLAEDLARKFCVSKELIFRRFRDRGLVTDQAFTDAKQEWDSQLARDEGDIGGNYYRTKIAYLGEEYITLAFKRFYQDRIDEEELADYLAIKPKHLGQLEDTLFEVSR
ncbi:MAG: ImmA/IrrE family metallo-endopeptidase [Chloroflexi bacterium]|nr:ImmA/IrrE family metallo-endopeptidase [Chloroflexota bacterium]